MSSSPPKASTRRANALALLETARRTDRPECRVTTPPLEPIVEAICERRLSSVGEVATQLASYLASLDTDGGA